MRPLDMAGVDTSVVIVSDATEPKVGRRVRGGVLNHVVVATLTASFESACGDKNMAVDAKECLVCERETVTAELMAELSGLRGDQDTCLLRILSCLLGVMRMMSEP
jgi:hypothetical protein